jgi:hypothetical protein
MLFRSADLDAIFDRGRTLAFRRWKRPTVKPGGTVCSARGLVAIDSIEPVEAETVTEAEAREAGYRDLGALLAMFDGQQGTCYRIRLRPGGMDPRDELRAALPTLAELDTIRSRLARLDGNAPWTKAVLRLIAENPAIVSTVLADRAGLDRFNFKDRVRKLKALGLTISLDVGYRLSPRGEAVLAALEA